MIALILILFAAASSRAAEPVVRVRVRETTVEAPLERYVAAVLAGESSIFRSGEALKAMAVAARTYAVRLRGRHAAEGYDFCSTTHCQRVEFDGISARLQAAADETAGELLWFEGKPAFTPYTRDCGGRSESAGAVWPDMRAPYLTVHDDPYCARAGSSAWQWNGDPRKIAAALQRAGLRTPQTLQGIAIAQRTDSGRALTLVLSGAGESVRVNAGSFRFAIGRDLGWNSVLSDRFEIQPSAGSLRFQGRGSGHGAGLCQHGAEQMGIEGSGWREILAFYYPGASPGLTARGISWQQLCGDSVCVRSTDPQQDRAVLALAERQLRTLAERTQWPPPPGIEIRVYPDLDTFRNATGEPGWVAAHTAGRRIHLQPAALLRSRNALDGTLRHELLHVLMESQASPDLPLWFREGLAGFLGGAPPGNGPSPVPGHVPTDTELRGTADPARARRAYDDAAGAVRMLVNRYGEATVLRWVKGGLPAEVKNQR